LRNLSKIFVIFYTFINYKEATPLKVTFAGILAWFPANGGDKIPRM